MTSGAAIPAEVCTIDAWLSRVERRRRKREAALRYWISVGECVVAMLTWFTLLCIAASIEIEWYMGGYGPRYLAAALFGLSGVGWTVNRVLRIRSKARRLRRVFAVAEHVGVGGPEVDRCLRDFVPDSSREPAPGTNPWGRPEGEQRPFSGEAVRVRLNAADEETTGERPEPRLREDKLRELRQAIAAAFPELGLETDDEEEARADDGRDTRFHEADFQIQ